jgi:hypothetical protein
LRLAPLRQAFLYVAAAFFVNRIGRHQIVLKIPANLLAFRNSERELNGTGSPLPSGKLCPDRSSITATRPSGNSST